VRTLLYTLLAAFCVAGCRPERDEVTVFTAASLAGVMRDAEASFERANPDTDVILVIAGSQVLAAQILEGAPADVFCSADEAQMRRVADRIGDPVVIARGELVVVTRDADATDPAGVLRSAERVVLAAPDVPVGRYAREALTTLGLLDEVEPKLVSRELDVRGVLSRVQSADADAGVVYATDARTDNSLHALPFPPEAQPDVRYLAAVLDDAPSGEGAGGFLGFLTSDRGRALFFRHGFSAP